MFCAPARVPYEARMLDNPRFISQFNGYVVAAWCCDDVTGNKEQIVREADVEVGPGLPLAS